MSSQDSLPRSDQYLPPGWKSYDSGRGMFFKDELGRRFTSRRKVLEFMIDEGSFSKEIIYYVRDGLLDEGWCYHQDLPPGRGVLSASSYL